MCWGVESWHEKQNTHPSQKYRTQYEFDKLPGVLLEAIEEYAVTIVTEEIAKAEDKIIQKHVMVHFICGK